MAGVDAEFFYLPVVIVLTMNTLYFFYCQYKKDNGLIDVFWGVTFVVPLAVLLIKR